MRRFLLTLAFFCLLFVYWYAHAHLVWSLAWWPDSRNFGVVFATNMVDIPHIASLDQFNAWLGAHFAEDRPVTYTAWIGFLILSAVPSKALGVILFVVPFWVKVFGFGACYWLLMVAMPKRRTAPRTRDVEENSVLRAKGQPKKAVKAPQKAVKTPRRQTKSQHM
ncbi:hypothetical protein NZD89_21620 [Alicyclobacillus fastidiosus]|uniref:Uncharacterized protein n=1 Tax=Alicyclobacillus fastidiosus TaxID=392011 RepID=A0ABY6ZDA2_9BACL|nr:hypothetical protein [Alicyclobacillus fastidiosus]WAH40864.1 hypothetical protein NZD89_21620 [Alicyclobacillus fastidiosus]GMA62352.1 hypothetical protein GCM10025859_27920 [Alicyclobacillus fastidiosus]